MDLGPLHHVLSKRWEEALDREGHVGENGNRKEGKIETKELL